MVCKMSAEESSLIQSPGTDPDTLDLTSASLDKLTRATPELILNTTTLLLDNNNLVRLDNIHTYQCLEKLSVTNNQLVRMFQVGKLHHLKVLDLSHNKIVSIEGLKEVNLLTWLSLANNNIKTIENLNQNVHLEHLDLSGNGITTTADLSFLKNLKTLLLHNNKIHSLRCASSQLPPSLVTVTLCENQLAELRDVSQLAHLSRLEQLTVSANPCLAQPDQVEAQYDYRPYVINWCLGLRMLDGLPVGAKESLKAEWMYSQSKGRQFNEGEQEKLVEYLTQTCPLDPSLETEQDRKLNLILSKVQEHQSSLRQPRQSQTLPRSNSSDLTKLSASTPRRNSGPQSLTDSMSSSMSSSMMLGLTSSTPSSQQSTPVNTPASVRRHSSASRATRARSSPTPRRSAGRIPAPARYRMELPPTLYGEDLVNGNTDLMTQSMDPTVLTGRLDNESSLALMSQSADCSMLGETEGVTASYQPGPVRPRTLFSNRGSTDSGIRSDDQLELADISDSETSSILPGFARIQSRLNPVPESLNSPDIAPGPSPPRRDDPMISGPLSSLPPHLESRLNLGRSKAVRGGGESEEKFSPRQRPSDIMVAAVTARTNGAKTPGQQGGGVTVVTRPTSAVKPVNITSKVDSGLSRAGPGRVPVVRHQRSHSAGPARKNSLQHRQVESLRQFSTATSSKAATPEVSRKQQQQVSSLADDEASDTENEMREKSRVRKSSQDSGLSSRGRAPAVTRNLRTERPEAKRNGGSELSKSSSISNLSQVRPRSTSLTRSQSQRLGPGTGGGTGPGVVTRVSSAGRTSCERVRPRSSTLGTNNSKGSERPGATVRSGGRSGGPNTAATNIQAGWRGYNTRNKDNQVRDVKEELRTLRLEAHTKQLTKELKSAKVALEQERKLRKVQSDTIKVLWKEIQALQVEQEEAGSQDRRLERDKRRLSERKVGRMVGGLVNTSSTSSLRYEDSDSSRGEEESVAALSQTCVVLQSQVEQLQRNLASVVQFVSERSRHSSSSQDTPPLSRPIMTASLDLGPPPALPSSMTMSLPPSLILPTPPLSKSCDSLAQTDIVAVVTPQTEQCRFLSVRSELDTTSESEHTKLDSCRTSPRRPLSPRPLTLPGVSQGVEATPKRIPPINIPGMPTQVSPPGPPHLRSYASNIVSGLLSDLGREVTATDTADEVTDISASMDLEERKEAGRAEKHSPGRPSSRSSGRTVESDSLEDQQEEK